ncbi:hypothetical protein SISNIDRAFT_548117 [Sistotremastrum niveocremeum HHB9708]|uniref:ditrans,polycis-polyprenyl diphosphate synthase [(2E,6E)-farnesyldiphosphate specific] n=2 Tax=Sistotremastraceae TaxID=3402574 RepID=A0A164XHT2_9AGAM|nr:hypothetical protein SISNIDRAFT_548117 [Sistotremastrum niveocremeum HHB9708]KZT37402.1 hypothetical protein SISSUDRAFT_1129630 [Sistotremastrum suecicum HHB10207 ss-3]
MPEAAFIILSFVHRLYSLYLFWRHLLWQSRPKPLLTRRAKHPNRLAVILIPDPSRTTQENETCFLRNARNIMRWSISAGIERLSLYDQGGLLQSLSAELQSELTSDTEPMPEKEVSNPHSLTFKNTSFPLTPPPSDSSGSRPRSPQLFAEEHIGVMTFHLGASSGDLVECNKAAGGQTAGLFERGLILDILARDSSKPAFVSTARSLISQQRHLMGSSKTAPAELPDFCLSIQSLDSIMTGEAGFPSPDLLLVHNTARSSHDEPLALHGFPPWQIRLTELHHNTFYHPWDRIFPWTKKQKGGRDITEADLCRALDSYASAEMRLGK